MNDEGKQNSSRFLYGAAVQGIQGFIFQTNTLAEIVGASELVEEICTSLFAKALEKKGKYKELVDVLHKDKNAIVNAAGNIKYIFDNRDLCQKVVKKFPKMVMEYAPGVTISQAVVRMGDDKDFKVAVLELEEKLRTQRNKLFRDRTIGLMGIERSRQTGQPVVYKDTKLEENKESTTVQSGLKELVDEGTFQKLYYEDEDNFRKIIRKRTTQNLCIKAFGKYINGRKIAYDIEEMTQKNDWIAIIHADGNGMGQVIQKIGTKKEILKQFSQDLDTATTQAAVDAFDETISNLENPIPIRPIVLSGDDHTVICRADLAIPYIEAFIRHFEENTKSLLKGLSIFKGTCNDRLTACAGIAFIKSSYPFYYGYQLAEALCDRAKKDTKALYNADKGYLPASCIMFHKVQDSFVASYDDIVKRELTPQDGISFEFGPYYINVERQDRWSVEKLVDMSRELESENMKPVKSGLRNWLSLMHLNPEIAVQRLERLKKISGEKEYIDEVTKSRESDMKVYPVYDILAVNAVHTQETKKKKEEKK